MPPPYPYAPVQHTEPNTSAIVLVILSSLALLTGYCCYIGIPGLALYLGARAIGINTQVQDVTSGLYSGVRVTSETRSYTSCSAAMPPSAPAASCAASRACAISTPAPPVAMARGPCCATSRAESRSWQR